MWKWIPWQFLARRAAKAYGFADPVEALQRVRRFSHPSETQEPIELLRAGFAFHARGLANTKAIQNNLDWVWPYWVERQFDPRDISFVPRAFSFSHINLTHRNWTAIGLPEGENYTVVDPCGLVTPFHDSWSIDFWLHTPEGTLFPSKTQNVSQELRLDEGHSVNTRVEGEGKKICSEVTMCIDEFGCQAPVMDVEAWSQSGGYLVIAIRPYNPEGIRFVDRIEGDGSGRLWEVDGKAWVRIKGNLERGIVSDYLHGDFSAELPPQGEKTDDSPMAKCSVGMATAASLLPLTPGETGRAKIVATREKETFADPEALISGTRRARNLWSEVRGETARLSGVPEHPAMLYQSSARTVVLLSPHDIYPGPYTYRRFWFRDACLIAHALLVIGQIERCRRAIERFPRRQTRAGYFRSQEGEWDSNGQVLWLFNRYEKISGERLSEACLKCVMPAIRWIARKRVDGPHPLVKGLLPAGFSAEHFGPNDYYYWDNYWAVGGLEGAVEMFERRGLRNHAEQAASLARELRESIESSIEGCRAYRSGEQAPASPFRRMDSGAIGSLVADYPLQLYPVGETKMLHTAERMLERHLVKGAFFQDMVHSGINIYLTLALAQTLLRAGDPRWVSLLESCAKLASPTGQWPEAIHPRSQGGCMGDGQHAWASAEWIMLLRNMLLREEGEVLELGCGLQSQWLVQGNEIQFGPSPTPHGPCEVTFRIDSEGALIARVTCGAPRGEPPHLRMAVPGYSREERQGWGELRAMPLDDGRNAGHSKEPPPWKPEGRPPQ